MAHFCAPNTFTWETPLTMEMRWAIKFSAYSSTWESFKVGPLMVIKMMGDSAGLTFCTVGGAGIPGGSFRRTAATALCTSAAAPSIERSSANWMVILVAPTPLEEVIESMPETVANWRSSGVATAEAMVSGLAPGSEAFTWRVGKSTLGRSLTGSARYPAMPNNIIPIMTNAVITGRLIKISVIFMGQQGPKPMTL